MGPNEWDNEEYWETKSMVETMKDYQNIMNQEMDEVCKSLEIDLSDMYKPGDDLIYVGAGMYAPKDSGLDPVFKFVKTNEPPYDDHETDHSHLPIGFVIEATHNPDPDCFEFVSSKTVKIP